MEALQEKEEVKLYQKLKFMENIPNCEKRLQAAETLLEKIFAGQPPCNVLPEYRKWMMLKSGWKEVETATGTTIIKS